MRDKLFIIIAGAAVGLLAVLLVVMGNPANMGFCIACFIRDIAGGLGLHRAAVVQYLRPEIAGLILGSFFFALIFREFKATGGSSPVLRFFLGILMMAGALVFLGCPLRMLLRLAGGDLNALVALPGYVFGIWIGTLFLRKGYTLGRQQTLSAVNAYGGPVLAVALLVLLVFAPTFIFFSTEGPGSMRAALLPALGAGLLAGLLAQRSRLCTMGAVRDLLLFKDYQLFLGFAAIFITALIGNLLTGKFNLGFTGQPVAHSDHLWNFLGMAVVGLAAVLAGGCPLRQLILAGEGNGDAVLTVSGLLVGAALIHNFGLAASGTGVPTNGKVTVIAALILLLVIGFTNLLAGKAAARRETANSRGMAQ